MGWTVFSCGQGSGYIFNNEESIKEGLNESSVTINGVIINPGEETTLNDHFCRPLRYLGIKDEKEMIFYIGCQRSLFDGEYYYQSVIRVDENRIFELFAHG